MGKTNHEQENFTKAGWSNKQAAREDKASQSLQEERLRLAKDKREGELNIQLESTKVNSAGKKK